MGCLNTLSNFVTQVNRNFSLSSMTQAQTQHPNSNSKSRFRTHSSKLELNNPLLTQYPNFELSSTSSNSISPFDLKFLKSKLTITIRSQFSKFKIPELSSNLKSPQILLKWVNGFFLHRGDDDYHFLKKINRFSVIFLFFHFLNIF